MPSLLEQVTHDIADAMRQKEQVKLAALRMLKAAIMNKEVEKHRALDEAESLQVVNSLVKQRRDSIEQFKAGGRQDLVDREQGEIVFLQRYLPPAADEAAIAAAIEAAVSETGALSPKDMGKVMAALRARHAATLDMSRAGPMVKARLG